MESYSQVESKNYFLDEMKLISVIFSTEFAGSADFEKLFLSNAVYLVQKAKNATDNGDFFPIWGTCLGFQLLSYIESGLDSNVLVSGFSDKGSHILE